MGDTTRHAAADEAWKLVRCQHGVITRDQLLTLGFSPKAIKHRVAKGRLHPVKRGVYAVGRPDLTREARFIAAVLACGPTAALSHGSAAALWGIRPEPPGSVEVSIPNDNGARPAGIRLHRRRALTPADITHQRGIRVTTPICTLIDLAPRLPRHEMETAINQADVLGLTDPEALRAATHNTSRGAAKLRTLLDRRTFTFTRSVLERHFLP